MTTRTLTGRRVRQIRAPYSTSASPRSRARATTSGSRPPPREVVVQPAEISDTSCIDLTEDDIMEEVFVDLTSVNDSPVVRVGNHRRGPSPLFGRNSPVVLDHTDESSTELPEIDFGRSKNPKPREVPSRTSLASSLDEAKVSIHCPVCFDSVQEIRRTERQLMSTICGHLFCNVCIVESLQKIKSCPVCRKKLTTRQIHALYLDF